MSFIDQVDKMQRLATFLAVLAVISYSQAYRIKVVASVLLFQFILRVLLVDCNAHALELHRFCLDSRL